MPTRAGHLLLAKTKEHVDLLQAIVQIIGEDPLVSALSQDVLHRLGQRAGSIGFLLFHSNQRSTDTRIEVSQRKEKKRHVPLSTQDCCITPMAATKLMDPLLSLNCC